MALIAPNLSALISTRGGSRAGTALGAQNAANSFGQASGPLVGGALFVWQMNPPMTFVNVLTSPLRRARRTGELAGFGAQAEADADLMEWDYGAYEGRRTADILAERPGWRLFEDGCPGGETVDAVGARADRVIGRIRACPADVLLFAHRDIFRVLAARWLGIAAQEGRHSYLTTASLSVLGYHHDLDEPMIHLWNDARD